MKLRLPVESGPMSVSNGGSEPAAARAGTSRAWRGRGAGFTLVELMIVVAIVAILTAIAYPSYTHYTIKTRRTAAKACLSELANYMERYYTTNLSYADAADPKPDCESTAQTGNYYSYAIDAQAATTYTISATPQPTRQPDTECGTLKLDQTGKRTSTGDPATCW